MVELLNHAADPLRYGLKFRGRPKGEVFYGVELEVEAGEDRVLVDAYGDHFGPTPTTSRQPYMTKVIETLGSDFAVCKHDGSLLRRGAGGFEIVTAPASLVVHRKRWEKLFKADLTGISVSRRCGMHVHVSRAPLDNAQIGRMVVFVNEPDNTEFIERIAGRTSAQYAKRLKKSLNDIRSYDRYEALNVSGERTVELRIFAATLDRDRFFVNLEFAVALVEWAAGTKSSTVEDLKTYVSAHSRRFELLAKWLLN